MSHFRPLWKTLMVTICALSAAIATGQETGREMGTGYSRIVGGLTDVDEGKSYVIFADGGSGRIRCDRESTPGLTGPMLSIYRQPTREFRVGPSVRWMQELASKEECLKVRAEILRTATEANPVVIETYEVGGRRLYRLPQQR